MRSSDSLILVEQDPLIDGASGLAPGPNDLGDRRLRRRPVDWRAGDKEARSQGLEQRDVFAQGDDAVGIPPHVSHRGHAMSQQRR
jgi:hypothetical protein